MDLADVPQLLAGEAAEVAALVAVVGQLRRARVVPEDVRLVARREVGGLEVDALAGAQQGRPDARLAAVFGPRVVGVGWVEVFDVFGESVVEDLLAQLRGEQAAVEEGGELRVVDFEVLRCWPRRRAGTYA